ncbi:MAG: metal-dependent hydrolase [Salinigranum sp.]
MMATTHGLAGVALGAGISVVAPDLGHAVVLAGAAGGVFPDLDLYAGHRKTLHFPVYYSAMAAVAAVGAALVTTPLTAAVAVFLAAAALHSISDVAGGGLELKPWLGTSQRAVYSHFHGRWIAPKRWVRYDGSPEDLVLASWLALPGVALLDGPLRLAVLGALAVSATYVLVRKPLVDVAERIVTGLPAEVVGYLPERFVEDFR